MAFVILHLFVQKAMLSQVRSRHGVVPSYMTSVIPTSRLDTELANPALWWVKTFRLSGRVVSSVVALVLQLGFQGPVMYKYYSSFGSFAML